MSVSYTHLDVYKRQAQKDAATAADAEKPDLVIQNLLDMIPWLDQINPDMHIDEAQQSSGMFVPFF